MLVNTLFAFHLLFKLSNFQSLKSHVNEPLSCHALCIALSNLNEIKNDGTSFYLKMLSIVVDKLIRLQIINCSTVVNWIFSKEMNSEFERYAK